ncbi:hypothetical protein TNCV_1597091 [Trichonephila clavipes]|nr:hypothetical protein TNCV_1597091 [Trichonephila clavipes]
MTGNGSNVAEVSYDILAVCGRALYCLKMAYESSDMSGNTCGRRFVAEKMTGSVQLQPNPVVSETPPNECVGGWVLLIEHGILGPAIPDIF